MPTPRPACSGGRSVCRTPLQSAIVRVFLFALPALALSACGSSAVPVTLPLPPAHVVDVCAQLATHLPEQVEGQPRRRSDPSSPLTAVWGQPPIVLRCGVSIPAEYSPTAQLLSVNGVDWLPVEQPAGARQRYVFTTIGRAANVEVLVPPDYAPEVNPLTDLAGAITAQVPMLAQ